MLGRVSAQNGSFQQLSIFIEVLNRIQNDYVDEPSVKQAVEGAIRGLIESVDPQGGFLSPKDIAFFKDYSPLKTPSIGAVLSKRAGYPIIIAAIPGGPAAKAGLSSGDFIEAIDGVTTREMNLVQVNSLLANPVGKPASLVVIRRRRAEPETMSLNREVVPSPPVEAKMLEGGVAYVKAPYLSAGKALEVRKQLDALVKKGATGVVLDLRFAAGGDEKEGADLANLFLESGALGYVQGQKMEKRLMTANPKLAFTKLPLVVLINQGTAGAAEIAAGAIADNNRGQLVGTRTFGYGSVQKVIPLEDGRGLLLSIGKYYTPAGKEIAEGGITPSVEASEAAEETVDPNADDQLEVQPPTKDQPAGEEDRQLKKAIDVLKNPVASIKRAA